MPAGLLKHIHTLTSLTREPTVLTTVAIILLVLWALGLLGGYSAGGLLHLLLVVAAVIIVLRLLSGRRAV